MRAIQQFRYYGDSRDNYPSNGEVNAKNLHSGRTFSSYSPILRVGIQGPEGTTFYFNNSVNPIMIDSSGVFDLDLSGEAQISALSFDIESLVRVHKASGGMLLIDIIYEKEDSE